MLGSNLLKIENGSDFLEIRFPNQYLLLTNLEMPYTNL